MATSKKTTSLSKAVTKTPRNTVIKTSKVQEAPAKASLSGMFSEKKNIRMIVVLGLILAGLYYARGFFIVAFVNGQPVTRYEVVRELEKQAGQGTVDAIVSEKLIRMKAKEEGVTVEQSEIDGRIKDIETDLASTGQNLDELLELQGISRKEVEDQTRLQLLLKGLLADKVAVTDKEVDEAYEQQLEVKPEDMTEEEFKAQVRSGLENQKFSFEAQTYVQSLQDDANITYWLEY